jgi:Cu/Zn superoxide dismutase
MLALLAVATMISGCASVQETMAMRGGGLVANLRGSGSAATGVVRVFNYRDGVVVELSIANLIPGTYRIALHDGLNCKSSNLFSAGPAWAPPGSNKSPGDLLPQFVANNDSNVNSYVAYISGVRTEGPTSLRGRLVVIHYGSTIFDAFPGQPNNRVACGVLDNAEGLLLRE